MWRAGIDRPMLYGLAAAVAVGASLHAASAEQSLLAADPGPPGESARQPLCCGVQPAGEVRADHVFGRWVVLRAGIGAPMRAGEPVEFRDDGRLQTRGGLCRFAILRAELTIACAGRSNIGDVRFEDDTKLIWRHDSTETIFIAPAN